MSMDTNVQIRLPGAGPSAVHVVHGARSVQIEIFYGLFTINKRRMHRLPAKD